MPAIPVYSSSPITAAKPSGTTPQTAQADDGKVQTGSSTTTAATGQQAYLAPQPGAAPSLPAQTGAPQPSSHVQPTPTQSVYSVNPPPPQPGAVPTLPSATKAVPPPPKSGETLQQQPPPPGITAAPMPPQMSYSSPDPTFPGRPGASTMTAATTAAIPQPGPLLHSSPPAGGSFSHPPGYHQDINAADFSSNQRAAHEHSVAQNSTGFMSTAHDQDGPGMWDAAKKWAAAAGDSLASAESEVWKRINKE